MLSLLLVDPYRLTSDVLANALGRLPNVATVSQAADADTALQILREKSHDLILMDAELKGTSPFAATKAIRVTHPECWVLFLSGNDYDSHIQQAIDAGAAGYMLKHDSFETLTQAIADVTEGRMFFSKSILVRLRNQNGQLVLFRPRSPAIAKLTERERELLVYISTGAGLKEAAALMNISYKTADNQKTSLMKKLNIHDRVELTRFAIREGVVTAFSHYRHYSPHDQQLPNCVSNPA